MNKKKSKLVHFVLFIAFLYYAITPFLWRYHDLTGLIIHVDPSLNILVWLGFLTASIPVFTASYYLLYRYTFISVCIGSLLLNLSAMVAGVGMRYMAF